MNVSRRTAPARRRAPGGYHLGLAASSRCGFAGLQGGVALIGKTLSQYEITARIGAGGMGEVYRATDTRLGREVAIKVLPADVAEDPERLARFEREAKLLASLNHPNIAAIHGLEEADGTPFLALELVEGEDLAERLTRGPLPEDEALEIAVQVADALEEAHGKGVMHRDLKPANIMLTPGGQAKVLDFGLARAYAPDPKPGSSVDVSRSPTLTHAMTRMGTILGTPAYMSPEQARGRLIDRRTDLWAFGCVLFEMLVGEALFRGDTPSDVLASVLRAEPEWTRLPSGTPRRLQELLERCLRRDPKRRLRDAGDARVLIEEIGAAPPAGEAPPAARRRRWGAVLPWALVAVLAAVAALRSGPPAVEDEARSGLVQLSIPTAGLNLPILFIDNPVLDVSRDGSQVVFLSGTGTTAQLFHRRMDSVDVRAIPGTGGATTPVFSPDGQWIAFFHGGKLKRASPAGLSVLEICDVLLVNRGLAWGEDGHLVFSPGYQSGLLEVPASGGEPRPLTQLDTEAGERTHRWPQVLPGGDLVLFTVGSADSPNNYDAASLAIHSRSTGRRSTVLKGATMGRYLKSGHIVFLRSDILFAAPFDVGRLELTGDPMPVSEAIGAEPSSGAGYFSASDNGVLVYAPATSALTERLVLADETGSVTLLNLPPGRYRTPRFSPDGRRIAYSVGAGGGANDSVWIYDLETRTSRRLTFGDSDLVPVWSSDGQRVYYSSVRGEGTGQGIYWRASDGSGAEQMALPSDVVVMPSEMVDGGRRLLLTRYSPTIRNIEVSLSGQDPAERLLGTGEGYQWGARTSPNGRWLAYASTETGREEVYVEPLEGAGRWQVSRDGGIAPLWSPDGRTLFFADHLGLNRVDVRTGDRFEHGPPERLFEGRFRLQTSPLANHDISPRGDAFILVQPDELAEGSPEILVNVNWFPELRRLLTEGR